MEYLNLIRVHQWYKNIFVFAAFFFFDKSLTYSSLEIFVAFLGFCLVSSITYIINDIVDIEKDRIHPVKKNRPLPSGKVSKKEAFIIIVFLSLLVFCSIYFLNLFYGLIILGYFLFTNFYSFGLKNIPIVDMTLIAFNFSLRALAGFSHFPDKNTLIYFLIIFLLVSIFVISKRHADREILGEKAIAHKPVIKFYTQKICIILSVIFYILLAISFFTTEIIFYKSVLILIWIFGTNFILWKNPEISLSPYKIFRNYLWDIASIFLIIILIF